MVEGLPRAVAPSRRSSSELVSTNGRPGKIFDVLATVGPRRPSVVDETRIVPTSESLWRSMTTLVTREGNKDTYCKDDPEWAGAEAKRRAATQAVRVWLVGGPGCSQRRQGNREDSHSRCRDGWQCLWKKPARAPCLPSASFPPSHPLPSPPSRPQREGINGCVDQSPAGRSISIYGERCVVPVVHPEQLSVLERSGNRQKGGCSIRSLTSVISDPRFVEPPVAVT